ncbi:glyoxalase bleomycin resistance protein dioxygenase superfamily [Colletotrichum higginsianum]|nr:glyoxalase bleomycin resistance protein dioxygenase superfamily [Colletotrichum higginsianum]
MSTDALRTNSSSSPTGLNLELIPIVKGPLARRAPPTHVELQARRHHHRLGLLAHRRVQLRLHPGPHAQGPVHGLVYDDPVPGGRIRLVGAELKWVIALLSPDGAVERGQLPFGCCDRTPARSALAKPCDGKPAPGVDSLGVDVSSDLGGGVIVKVDFVPLSGPA